MRIKTWTLAVSSCLVLSVAALSQMAKLPVNWKGLPEPFATPSSNNRPEVVSRPEGAKLELPKGFAIEEFASGFNRPRFMMLGPGNEILMSDSGDRSEPNGAVYIIKKDGKTKIIDGLDRPYGLAMWKDYLYVAEPTSLKRYKYDAKAMKAATPGEEVVSLKGHGQGHWTRSVLFDAKGEKMYLTVGSGSNVDTGEDPIRATIGQYNPDGSGHKIYAAGVRNVIGLRWHPTTKDLWAAVQERDGLGDDLVSDYLINVRQGGFYGWPYAYTGPHEDPRNKGKNPELVKKTLYPDVLLGAHVAVLDILFYTGNQFPKEYQGGMFLAFHGSWNRANRTGYSINYIPFKDGRPASGPAEFLKGWMLDPGKREVWGRPVGLLQMPDGSLLVSDDGGQKVWRISYKG